MTGSVKNLDNGKMVVKRMKNRTVFILVALITVVAGSLFISTTDVKAATVGQETIECPAGVEVSVYFQMPTDKLELKGDHPANTDMSYYMQEDLFLWTLTFTPTEIKKYEFEARDPDGNVFFVKVTSTDPNDIDSINVLSGRSFANRMNDPLYRISSIQEGASWLRTKDNELYGTAPNVDQDAVYPFLVKGKMGSTTTYRYVDIYVNVVPCSVVDVIQSPGGTITPSNDLKSPIGNRHTFEFKADAGFGLADVLIDMISDPTAIKTGKYTLETTKEEHTVTAIFSPLFSVDVGTNGNVYSNGSTLTSGVNDVLVNKGTNKQFIFIPDYGYRIDRVEVDGVNDTDAVRNGSYTFSNVQAAQSLKVTFTETNFNITIEQRFGEMIVDTERISIHYNAEETVNFIPPVGYSISEILIDGVKNTSATDNKKYEFTVTKDISVVVKLDRLSYFISYSVLSGPETGMISMVGTGNVLHGNDRTFNITPATGYQLSAVTLNSVPLTDAELEVIRASGKYTFYDVTEIKNIVVTFANIGYNVTIITDGNGTVNNETFIISKVPHGADLEIRMMPNTGYSVKGISVNGVPIGGTALDNAKNTNRHTLNKVQGSQTVSITFEKMIIKVSISKTGNGTVFSETDIVWETDQKYEFRPYEGYYVEEVLVDGRRNLNAESNGFHIFEKICEDHSLYVVFTRIYLNICFTNNLTASKNISVEYGSSKRIDFKPSEGYAVSSVIIDDMNNTDARTAEFFEFINVKTDHDIHVLFTRKICVVSTTSDGDGKVTPKTANVEYGGHVDLEIISKVGSMIRSVTVNGVPLSDMELKIIRASGSYRLASIGQTHDIYVMFEKIAYSITFLSLGNGTINSKNYGMVDTFHGGSTVLSIVPDSGHFVKEVVVDGKFLKGGEFMSVVMNKDFEFYNISRDHSISVTFERYTYSVETESGENGTISPDSSLNSILVQHDKGFMLYIYPKPGYRAASVQCNGKSVGDIEDIRETGKAYIDRISSDSRILVLFEKVPYTISFSAGEGGRVNEKVSGTETVLHENDTSFSITMSEGFRISDVHIDGTSVTDLENIKKKMEYRFAGVVADHTLTVFFERIFPKVTVSTDGKGSVSPGTSEFEWKGHKNFEFSPQEGYYLKAVLIDGTEDTEARKKGSVFFEMLQSDHTLHVIFAKMVFTITVKKDINGTMTNEEFIVYHQESVKIHFEPAEGHVVRSVLLNDTENENARIKGSIILEGVIEDHEICVTISKKEYTVLLDVSGNGKVTPYKEKISHGDDLRIDIFPDTGNVIRTVIVDGRPVSNDVFRAIVTIGHYVITDITKDHELKVVFERISYTIKFSSQGKGNIDTISGGEKMVYYGGNVFLSITPHQGCFIKDVAVDGIFLSKEELSPVVKNEGFLFTNVTKDHSVSAVFDRISYSVKIEGGKNGTVSPNNTANDLVVQHGYGFTFYALPEIGHRVSSVDCNGITITAAQMQILRTSGKITIENITSDLDISVSFERTPYEISFTAGEGGSVNGKTSGKETVLHGKDIAFSILPAEGFRVAEVQMDGITIDTNEYLFANVTEDHELKVLFEPIFPKITVTSTDGGNISPDGTVTVPWNGHQIFHFDPAEGYYIKCVYINGIENSDAKTRGSYFFNNIQKDHTLHVVFAKKEFCITVTKDIDDEVIVEKIIAEHGETKRIDLRPADGHALLSVFIDLLEDRDAMSNGFVEFENTDADHAVSVTVKRIRYDLSLIVTGNGMLAPDKNIIHYGMDVTITISPKTGNVLRSMTVNGTPLTDNELNIVKAAQMYTLPKITADNSIEVVFEELLYSITYSSGEGGKVNAGTYEKLIICHGMDAELNIIPDTGYRIENIAVDGTYLSGETLNDTTSTGKFTFGNVTADHSVVVSFTRITYTITTSIDGNGSIVPNGASGIILPYGEEVKLTFIPGQGYHLSALEIDGTEVSSAVIGEIANTSTYTIKGNSDHSVKVYFESAPFSVSVNSDPNGVILINGLPELIFYADQGDTLLLSFTPNSGYRISDVIVNNVSNKNGVRTGEYEIQNINSNHDIKVIFERITFNVLISTSAGGAVTYIGDNGGIHTISSYPLQKMYGDDLEMNITPHSGYRLKIVTENGKELSEEELMNISLSGKYTLLDLTEDVDVVISFERTPYTIFLTVEGKGALIDGNNVMTRSHSDASVTHASEVLCGDDAVFEILPSAGYCIKSITINGKELKGETLEAVKNEMRYIFQAVGNDSSLEVKFKKKPFTVSSTVVGNNGSISKEGITDVQYGDSFYLEFYPDNDYKVKEVIINGESNRTAAENGYYVLEGIQNDVSILVSYESIFTDGGTSIGIYVLSIICVAAFITLIYGLFALQKVRKLSKD